MALKINQTFDYQFCFKSAMKTIDHRVACCSHNKYNVKSETIFES